jgi:hypothetical protein
VQPTIIIDYKTGASRLGKDIANEDTITTPEPDVSNNYNKTFGVYRTPSGKKYHLDSECGGKNSYSVTMQEALDAGLTLCSKCID